MGIFAKLFGRKVVQRVQTTRIDGQDFPSFRKIDELVESIRRSGIGMLHIQSTDYQRATLELHRKLSAIYGEPSRQVRQVYAAALHCAQCKMEFPSSFKLAVQGGFGPGTSVSGAAPGFREFGQGGSCPGCGCHESLLVYEHFSPDKITADDVLAIGNYRRQSAKLWWESSGRTAAICEDCNADIRQGEGFLAGSRLICDRCMRENPFYVVTLEKLRGDPDYYGANLLRKARRLWKPEFVIREAHIWLEGSSDGKVGREILRALQPESAQYGELRFHMYEAGSPWPSSEDLFTRAFVTLLRKGIDVDRGEVKIQEGTAHGRKFYALYLK
jgi:hypothetical protein